MPKPFAPLRYPGAKWMLGKKIAGYFEEHYHYVEPFFGSGAVFFSKEPSRHEVINDLDQRVVSLFRVIRDRADELAAQLDMTPWSRVEYDLSYDEETGDELENARRFVVRTWQAHASDLSGRVGWRNRGTAQRRSGMSHRWARVPDEIMLLANRLLDAEIECRPALEVIQRVSSSSDALIYADPPYLRATRANHMYRFEMLNPDEHLELLDALKYCRGQVILSGYMNDLYARELKGWRVEKMPAPRSEGHGARTEVLWIKDKG